MQPITVKSHESSIMMLYTMISGPDKYVSAPVRKVLWGTIEAMQAGETYDLMEILALADYLANNAVDRDTDMVLASIERVALSVMGDNKVHVTTSMQYFSENIAEWRKTMNHRAEHMVHPSVAELEVTAKEKRKQVTKALLSQVLDQIGNAGNLNLGNGVNLSVADILGGGGPAPQGGSDDLTGWGDKKKKLN